MSQVNINPSKADELALKKINFAEHLLEIKIMRSSMDKN